MKSHIASSAQLRKYSLAASSLRKSTDKVLPCQAGNTGKIKMEKLTCMRVEKNHITVTS